MIALLVTMLSAFLNGSHAEFQRVISSPDLAGLARTTSFSQLPLRHRQILKETPEERLQRHLHVLKHEAQRSVLDEALSIPKKHVLSANDQSTVAARPLSVASTDMASKIGNKPATNLEAMSTLHRPLDVACFSTVTPEPSDSMLTAPDACGALGSCPLGHQSHGISADSSADKENTLQQHYLRLQRSISASKTSAVCFDFDRTLSQDHIHQMTQASRTGLTREEAIAAFGGHRRIQHLSTFLSELEACGVAIHIVSLGHKEDIMAALVGVGLDHLFSAERVYGCDEMRKLRLVTKAQCIAHVAALLRLRRQDILLVDDDHDQLLECSDSSECELPLECGGGAGSSSLVLDQGTCGTYWVKSGRGLTDQDMAAISGMARSRFMALHDGIEV